MEQKEFEIEMEKVDSNQNLIEKDNFKNKIEPPKRLFSRSLSTFRNEILKKNLKKNQKQQMKEMKGNSTVMFLPTSPTMQYWFVVLIFGLLFTALVTPYETALLSTRLNGLFWINRIVDLIFFTDIILQFFTAYKEEKKGITMWVTDLSLIRMKYLRSWFILDVISIFPFDVIGLGIQSHALQRLKSIRLLRLVRLLKIAKILENSNFIERIQAQFSIDYNILGLVNFIFLMLIVGHWMACLWALVGNETRRSDRYSWIDFADSVKNVNFESHFNIYIISLYWAFMTLTTIGYGDIVPQNISEILICNFCMVSGGLVWAYILGSACGVLSRFAQDKAELQQSIDRLNKFSAENNFPREMQARLRRYFYNLPHVKKLRSHQVVIDRLSPALQNEVAGRLHQSLVTKVWYLKQCEFNFVTGVAKKFVPAVFAPEEQLDSLATLHILSRGIASRKGKVLTPGGIWGEDFILDTWTLIDKSQAIAVNYVEVLMLSRESLEMVIHNFSASAKIIRKAAIRTAILRQVVLLANRVSKKLQNNPDLSSLDALLQVLDEHKKIVYTRDMLSAYSPEVSLQSSEAIQKLSIELKEMESTLEKILQGVDIS